MKRMQALLVSYEEQKSDLKPEEKQERLQVIKLLREALKLLRHDYDQQTKRFEAGGGFRQAAGSSPRGYPDQNTKPSYRDDANEPYTMITDHSQIGFSLNQDQSKGLIKSQHDPSANIELGSVRKSENQGQQAHQET